MGSSTSTTGHDQKNAPDPVTPPSQDDWKCLRRWLHVAGIVVIGLIALGAIVVAIAAVVACSWEGKCVWGHGQHLLAVLGTLTAALASFRQGRTAKTKSWYHEDKKADADHNNDFEHFKKVSFWWYTFLGGALAAAVAEFIDWSGLAGQ